MFTYQAPRITLTWKEFFKKSAFWLFPLTLFYGCLQGISSLLFGRWVSQFILPAQSLEHDYPDYMQAGREQLPELAREYGLHCEWGQVISPKGKKLHTVELQHPKEQQRPKHERTVIVYMGGNNASLERLETSAEWMQHTAELECTTVLFNPRGVGLSSGKVRHFQHMVHDAIYQTQRMLDSGIPAEKIFLTGRSLGGLVAIAAAYHFNQRSVSVQLYDMFTFDRTSEAALSLLRAPLANPDFDFNELQPRTNTTHKPSAWARIGLALIEPLRHPLRLMLSLVKWEVASNEHRRLLPAAHKQSLTIHPPKATRRLANSHRQFGDLIIDKKASRFQAEKREHRRKQDFNASAAFCNKVMLPQDDGNAHNAPLARLQTRYGESADQLFYRFVRRDNSWQHPQQVLTTLRQQFKQLRQQSLPQEPLFQLSLDMLSRCLQTTPKTAEDFQNLAKKIALHYQQLQKNHQTGLFTQSANKQSLKEAMVMVKSYLEKPMIYFQQVVNERCKETSCGSRRHGGVDRAPTQRIPQLS